MTAINLDPCKCCGAIPKFRSERKCFGHGEYADVVSIQCECGMATKGVAVGYEGSLAEVQQKVRVIWNRKPE